MVRSTTAMIFARVAPVAAAVASCGSKAVHLGDGCPHPRANGVLWIGDTWTTLPGIQLTRVRDLARAKGAIGPNKDYAVATAAATTMGEIADQCSAYEAGATKVRVLIMDGGGWDTIIGGGSAASVAAAGDAFRQLLATVASDGTVQEIIYFLYPELHYIFGVSALHPVREQGAWRARYPAMFSTSGHCGSTMPSTPTTPSSGPPRPARRSLPTRSGRSCKRTA
jgi:hypothetical protein